MEEIPEINEINLSDLMFYCLRKWRWIFVCMILFAIIIGIYKYQATITENQIKKEKQLNHTVMEQIEEKVESEPVVFVDPVSSAIKFAIMGMIGGCCVVPLIFCLNYIVSDKLQNERDFQKKFGMPLLGVIRRKEVKKKLFGFVDCWICRLEEGPYAKIARSEQIKITIVNIQNAIHNKSEKKIKRIMLAGTIASNDVIEICKALTEEIGDVTFSPYRQVVFQAAALKKLEYYEAILFIEKKGESYEKLIRQEKNLALDRDIKIIGVILC